MVPIIDFSYFALRKVQGRYFAKNQNVSSILLYDKNHHDWETLLTESTHLWNFMHEQCGYHHYCYIPHKPTEQYMNRFSPYLRTILEPAHEHIKTYLLKMGVEDVEMYMKNSFDWMSLLFSKAENQNHGCILINEHIPSAVELPLLIVWTDSSSSDLLIIRLVEENDRLLSYFKTIFWALNESTKSFLRKRGKLTIVGLRDQIIYFLRSSVYFRNKLHLVPSLDTIQLRQPIRTILEIVGNDYSNRYDDAIINFQKNDGEKYLYSALKQTEDLTTEVKRLLLDHGFHFLRQGGNHEIWMHPKLNKITPIPRHNRLNAEIYRSIRRDILMITS
jgi:predicted RNA binding protein YcfA (HicA-like mRNA interferase family)